MTHSINDKTYSVTSFTRVKTSNIFLEWINHSAVTALSLCTGCDKHPPKPVFKNLSGNSLPCWGNAVRKMMVRGHYHPILSQLVNATGICRIHAAVAMHTRDLIIMWNLFCQLIWPLDHCTAVTVSSCNIFVLPITQRTGPGLCQSDSW